MRLSDIEKGYIAGLIDGEGYIGLAKGKNKYNPRIGIGMTNYEVLNWLKERVGGCLYMRKKFHETDSQSWCYVMTAKTIREVLPVIMPCLIVKKQQAQVMEKYLFYFKANDRDAMKGLKAVIKDEFHHLFKVLNSRGNRKRGEFKEYLSETTLSQVLEEIQEKVHRLKSDANEIRKLKILSTLKRVGKIARSSLASKHYFNVKKHWNEFNKIMQELEVSGLAKKSYNKHTKHLGFSYLYAGNDYTSALPERDEIVGTIQQCIEVEDKELLR